MQIPLELESVGVVLRGRLNPAIFSPAWLAKQLLISDSELEAASVQVIHPELAKFEVNSLEFEVTQDRFQLVTKTQPFVRLLDVILELFERSLPHTPISQLGINYDVEFVTKSPARRVALGRALAPTAPWGDFGKRIDASKGDTVGGLLKLVLRENSPSGREYGFRHVAIGPSMRVETRATGIAMHINDHFEIADENEPLEATRIMNILRDEFDSSISESRRIVGYIVEFERSLA